MKVLYASDLDRTLIFSYRYLAEHPTTVAKTLVEVGHDGKEISYIANSVASKLKKINKNENIFFVPVTTRSTRQYKKIKLGFEPEYAITSNGGVILHNGEPIEEYKEYIRNGMNKLEIMTLTLDFQDFDSVDYTPVLVDDCYLFFKTLNESMFDVEVSQLESKYPNWDFVRQKNKCYAIPKHFSKQIALRWLWHKFEQPYIVASGDSKLDLPMLTLANKVVIPEHASLLSEGIVLESTTANGGIESALKTIQIVKDKANSVG